MRRKSKKDGEKQPQLLLTYKEFRTGGDPVNLDDQWTDHEDEYIDWTPLEIYVDEPGLPVEKKTSSLYTTTLNHLIKESVVPGDTLHLVIVRYTTGSTFGTSYGAWHIEAVSKIREKALHITELIKEDEKEYSRNSKDQSKYVSSLGYKCWRGYFETFEDSYVVSLIVK